MKSESILFTFILILLLLPLASAGKVTFSVNQSKYYFSVGESGFIDLYMKNTYDKDIIGMLTYSFSQETNQGGAISSSINTQSTSFLVKDGESSTKIGLGTSNSPITLLLNLKFSFDDEENPMKVEMDEIEIYFVENEEQKQNKEDQQKSSSKNQNSMTEQMQKAMEDMFKEEPKEPSTQEKISQNQMQQDSSSLKQQMQKDMQKHEEMKQNFQKELEQSQEIAKAHQELQDKGYQMKSGTVNPENDTSGSFEFNYENQKGEQAKLSGEMQNKEITKLNTETSEDKNNLMNQLNNNSDFQKFQEKLNKSGFNETNINIEKNENKTEVKIEYKNEENQTAVIKAEFLDEKIEKVILEKENNYILLWVFLILVLGVVIYYVYQKYYVKKEEVEEKSKPLLKQKPFNYKKEARKLISEAEKEFANKNYKEAYSKAGQGIRLFFSYQNGLKKEITNYELIQFLRTEKKDFKRLKQILDLCSLVEFAKYTPNKKDFNEIIECGKKVTF